MTKRVTFTGKNGSLEGELALPKGDGKAPALLVIQEWHGVTDYMRSLVDRFAEAGFVAMAPDLYHGKVAKNDDEAGAMMKGLDFAGAVAEIGSGAAFLKSHERCSGKVGITGFCLGGALTFATALNVSGLSAAVPFYGLPQIPAEKFASVKTPILAHFAKKDDWATPAGAEAIKAAIEKGGGSMELHTYDGGHAFMRNTDATKYHEASAKLAWERTIAFLKKHLG
jgi:carboxymethylenebutenolidase